MTELARIPQVDAVLRHPDTAPIIAAHGRRPTAAAVRRLLDDVRARARDGHPVPDTDEIVGAVARDLATRRRGALVRVVNATGVVLHTNLGRAPLSEAARSAMDDAAGYCTLEYDLEPGRRGSRTAHVGRLAADACGAQAATVVNNGAGALVLVLAALSSGRDAIVSRGELVEIGGSFRLPDVMAASGAVLKEVGTTNRTRIDDYRAALSATTGLLLKVHRSNYRVVGFTAEPSVEQLAAVAQQSGVPLVYDTGSGLLRPVDVPGLEGEPAAEEALAAGADLVVFSGDKLLGGPQAGVVAGRADLVRRCARHPLARALRIDKSRRAALEVTLEAHLRTDVPIELPVWAMLTADLDELRRRADALAATSGTPARPVATRSLTGGGSLPGTELPSWGVQLAVDRPDDLARALRAGDPPVIARVDEGAVVLDLRTVAPGDDQLLAAALAAALRQPPSPDVNR